MTKKLTEHESRAIKNKKGIDGMNLIELDKQIKEHKIIQAFKDGVTDALIDGERNEEQSHHYYKQGYDFGLTLYNELYGKDWESE